jgi:hypothetical protein
MEVEVGKIQALKIIAHNGAWHDAGSSLNLIFSVLPDAASLKVRATRCALVRLIEQGIDLPYHPQTRGKIERFHRTLDHSVRHRGRPFEFAPWPALLEEFRQQYNQQRPHAALGMQPPALRAPNRAQPQPWEYPSGSTVVRLNTQGCLDYDGRRWFVCEALRSKQVRLQRFEDRILVSYRTSMCANCT